MTRMSTMTRSRLAKTKMPLLCLLACTTLLSLSGGGCEVLDPDSQTINDVSVVMGEDYSLPGWAHPAPYSGYIGSRNLPRPNGSMRVENLWLSWADLEPVRGQYNWEMIENKLAAAAAGGYQLNLHLQSITYGGGNESLGIVVDRKVPDWAEEEFGLTESDIINLGWEFDLLIIPGWRPDIRAAFNDLIRAFGARGYPSSPQLASAYILGISPSRGEEFWLSGQALDRLEQDHGFSANVLDQWITSRFEAYGEAFAGETYKLVWVGKQGSWRYLGRDDYSNLALRLVHDAWAMGAGNRSSAIEYYNTWLNEPALGQSVDENGYLKVDETVAPISSVRFFGDENEEYGEQWVWRFGSQAGEAQRYRFSLLRALQMRMRFLWTSDGAEAVNPALSHYVGMSLGQSVTTSADAWAYLRESPVGNFHSAPGVIRNFERYLTQRDLPGGITVATQRCFREFNAGSHHLSGADDWYDDLARRTDLASNNPYIYFDLDDRFLVSGETQVKVEILDNSSATWHLEYLNRRNEMTVTNSFHNRDDGKVRTVTFTLIEPRFANGMNHGVDFRIACLGPSDVAVRWVRLVRQQVP